MNPAEARLRRRIEMHGPISVADYMAEANAHYYATRDPLGAAGDFVTAPEISQMFGELAGIWLADLWQRAGRPEGAHYVELGPGRGTLAADALRAMRGAGLDPPVELVETSPVLRAAQAERLAARWHDDVATLPERRAAAGRRQRILRRAAGAPVRRAARGASRRARAAAASSATGRRSTRNLARVARDRPRACAGGSPRRAARR